MVLSLIAGWMEKLWKLTFQKVSWNKSAWDQKRHLFLFITSTNCTEISYLDHTGLPETIFPEKQTKKAEKISWICVCFSGNIISGSAVYLNKNLGSISKQQLWLNGRALDYKSGGLWIESHHLLNVFLKDKSLPVRNIFTDQKRFCGLVCNQIFDWLVRNFK